ncbi:hypothetical protein C7999DRAFT_17419 [Corynascus novoguineensis]|uniref:Copper acquisition factor BIM1-like domain-containing protein n=1 Tax=Corynascus novoguineensis TaxID=1126955 RepID=A0AAN7HGA7_9PEZI|nr:hypothetical protein C7999DRAFT_17419 [Corynascus novoguineensis]
MLVSAFLSLVLAQCLHWAERAHGHVVLTYPAWRGNNLLINDDFPFGMQWAYPCGGLTVTTNRTRWPLAGGAVAFQPGWFTGHDTALIYINIGLGGQPNNYSWPITKLHLDGPSDNPYPGTVCLPKVTLPAEVRSRIKSGDLASIQVVEAAEHGAGLFTCADIIFTADVNEVPEINERNCFNSTSIRISDVAILGSQELSSACVGLDSSLTEATARAAGTSAGDKWGWTCENKHAVRALQQFRLAKLPVADYIAAR